jgi:hypothetical protein
VVLENSNCALHDIAKSIILLQSALTSLDETRITSVMGISRAQAVRLQMGFDFLLGCAHIASAENVMGKYTKDTRLNPINQRCTENKDTRLSNLRTGKIQSDTAHKRLPAYTEWKKFLLNTCIGSLQIEAFFLRSSAASQVLAVDMKYLGNAALGSKSFILRFVGYGVQSKLLMGAPNPPDYHYFVQGFLGYGMCIETSLSELYITVIYPHKKATRAKLSFAKIEGSCKEHGVYASFCDFLEWRWWTISSFFPGFKYSLQYKYSSGFMALQRLYLVFWVLDFVIPLYTVYYPVMQPGWYGGS